MWNKKSEAYNTIYRNFPVNESRGMTACIYLNKDEILEMGLDQ